ncbi:Retrovirus-related Pol polyprotein from transposon TNT 1-94 [Sesbania bispinosa]|nr:Retrovirus-related Pol polyprotein from transposon TNT 1-94 [Sesbania bispinosa]
MATTKFDIQQFDGMWKVRMMAVLTQRNLKVATSGKEKMPATMKDSEWDEIDEKALSTIQLCITDDVLQEV